MAHAEDRGEDGREEKCRLSRVGAMSAVNCLMSVFEVDVECRIWRPIAAQFTAAWGDGRRLEHKTQEGGPRHFVRARRVHDTQIRGSVGLQRAMGRAVVCRSW
jgi:hypothetical protein